jgi:transposase
MRINKTDRNDAKGLAELIRMGWYREAKVKSMESRQIRALLAARSKLVDLITSRSGEPDARLVEEPRPHHWQVGRPRAAQSDRRPAARCTPSSLAHQPPDDSAFDIAEQIATYDFQVRELAKTDQTIGRLMTVPGVGPVTALAFASTVDDPQRFARATDVGAYRPDDINQAI